MARVLLVEDQVEQRKIFATFLASEGHAVAEAGSVADFDRLEDYPEIAIIDVGLPDGNGFDVAARLRDARPRAGIIILTGYGSEDDQVAALRGGVDQYLVKPVGLEELSACISALARRLGVPGWRLNTASRLLAGPGGYSETLSAPEIALMELLARNASQVVHRKTIATAFGADWNDYDERHLDQLVSRLRRRWRERSGEELPLRTEFGRGYSFCVAIEVQ